MPTHHDRQLPFGPVRNSELFANHWLDRRLPLEPEWTERREEARACLDRIAELWKDQEELAPKYGAEAPLEEAWIQPVLEALGWPLIYQTFVKGRKPDYALFLDRAARSAAVKAGRKEPAFWTHPKIVADAKAWSVSLDHRAKGGDREYPPEQIEWYLNQTALDWGMLTNDALWRLIPRQLARNQPRFETYLELNLPLLLTRWMGKGAGIRIARQDRILDEFLRWYLLATPATFLPYKAADPLIQRALSGSTAYRLRVGDELRGQVFEALRLCIEGFLGHRPNNLDPARDLDACRANSFTLLFRLLFILFAEDRQLLPYRTHQTYTNNRSLTRQHNELIPQLEGGMLFGSEVKVWGYWQDLFDLIDRGHATYGVPSYNGGLFDNSAHPFLTANKLPDPYAARVLDSLRRAIDPDSDTQDRVSVDYRDLAIQHLGNIYEGLLELHPRYAAEQMVVVAKREDGKTVERTIPASATPESGFALTDQVYQQGEVYLETDKGDRRASGSYYTPDHIVSYIVENTLGPLCKGIDESLRREIEKKQAELKSARNGTRAAIDADLATLRSDFDDRVLRLTVLDPAMGSGHFLISACQYLAAEIASNPLTGDPEEPADGQGDAPTLLFWKRRVIERCIYGVDKNPIAVELAKLALWLETVSVDQPLSFLDHHLRHGDSLIGARIVQLGRLHDAKLGAEALAPQTLEGALPALLKPLEDIRQTASATIVQVKAKERLYADTFEKVRQPFRALADLWTSTFFAPKGEPHVSTAQYAEAVKAIGTAKFKAVEKSEWLGRAIAISRARGIDAFHWEFEFPEVFLSPERRTAGRTGFDAIIGNPPYDVLAERELGRDLRALQSFIEASAIYDSSRIGKNNLYKLFICRALDLLAPDGRFGFIVPMSLLGDKITSGVRRAMFEAGALTGVEAFPQKDDPRQRVFPEAKLSTTVFSMVKTNRTPTKATRFRLRVHPGRTIEPASPAMMLTTADIPRYDPEFLVLPSCEQVDWDLAVRITSSGRTIRLGDVCTFAQGEVNETNQRKAGTLVQTGGTLVVRGAAVCLYAVRRASQGDEMRLNVPAFLDGVSEGTKAFDHRHQRVVLQESNPQNTFRRIIAAPLAAGEFCNHTINYCAEPDSKVDLLLLLAFLNSKLADWYFRLGSTNNHVSHYQLHALPFPRFADARNASDTKIQNSALAAIRAGEFSAAFQAIQSALVAPPFSPAVQDVLIDLARRIIRVERARGEIARVERSSLDEAAQPFQDLIDRIFFSLAGLTAAESKGLEERLSKML